MSTVSLLRPTTVATDVIVSTKFGATGTDLWIKVVRCRFRFTNPNVETTGDDDAGPSFDASYFQYCSFSFIGFAPGSTSAVATLASLTDSTKNPLASTMKVHLGTSHVLTFTTPLFEDIIIEHTRLANGGAVVALSMTGKNTGTAVAWATT